MKSWGFWYPNGVDSHKRDCGCVLGPPVMGRYSKMVPGRNSPGTVLTGTLVLEVYHPLELWPVNFCGYKLPNEGTLNQRFVCA